MFGGQEIANLGECEFIFVSREEARGMIIILTIISRKEALGMAKEVF